MDLQRAQAFLDLPAVVEEAVSDYNRIFGRSYSPFVEEFMTDGAEIVFFIQGGHAATARHAVRHLRERGVKAGLVKLRFVRPFTSRQVAESLSKFKAVGVIDRDFAHGSPDDGGIVLHEIRSCLYPLRQRPAVVNFICGLGGRDISIGECQEMFATTQRAATDDKLDGFVSWIGVRE